LTALVLDASVTLAWSLSDEGSAFAAEVLGRVCRHGAVVPAIWSLEVSNVLLVSERNGRLSPDDSTRSVALLRELPIRLLPPSIDADLGQVRNLARKHGLTTYDSAYLEAAVRIALPLATLDQKLATAAKAEGVPLVDGSNK
jgi:predicted nucleic acid-binding protein